MSKDHQVTGNIGLYYACYKLSRMGWNAMPTARNARGVDIIAYNRDCSRTLSIQVKTLSKRDTVLSGRSPDKIIGDFWIIVNDIKEYIALLLVHNIGPDIVQDEKFDFGKFFKSFQVIAHGFFL